MKIAAAKAEAMERRRIPLIFPGRNPTIAAPNAGNQSKALSIIFEE
jgi:hypothetical protein